jgi:hypothetical protein
LAAAAAALAVAPSALGAPTISGTDGEYWTASRTPVRYSVSTTEPSTVAWTLFRGTSEEVDKGRGLQVTLPNLEDGSYKLVVVDSTGIAARLFSVDTVAPTIVIRSPAEGAVYRAGQPVVADYSCEGHLVCVGTQPAGQPLFTWAAGEHALEVTAVDEAGNVTVVRRGYRVLEAAPVTPAPQPPPAAAPAVAAPLAPVALPRVAARVEAPKTTNAGRLRPRRGAMVASIRPTLRWPVRRGARFYNVQVFRLAGTRYVKVLSAFPRGNRLRVPPRRLKPGARHVWRVWPMVGRSFTPKPLGISYFEVRAPRR